MSRLLTEARMDQIRANHTASAGEPDGPWVDADDFDSACQAFEDRADLLDEVEAYEGALSVLVEKVADARIQALRFVDSSWSQGRANAFTEVLRFLAPRVTPDDFATVAELVKAVRKDPR